MKKYSSYKPSGVDWIGEIPESWDKKRLKYITKSINGYSFKSDDFDREFDIPVIRIGDVGDVIDFDNSVKVKSIFLEDKKDFIIKKDDILIGLTGGTIGKSGRYNYEFPSLLNQRVGLLRNNNLVLNGLLYHYVKSDIFIRYIFYYCYGGGQDNISMNDILNMVFPYPPFQEQEQIVNYLNDKTSIIDNLISTKQRKVELLKEQKITLINHIITKGLNPNVKMKDSGIEWIGEIPESWSLISIKHLVSTKITDGPHETPIFVDSGVPFLSVESVQDGKLDFNKKRGYITEELNKIYSKKCLPRKDDVLIVKSGSTTGKSTIVETDELFNIWSPLCIVRSNQNKIIPRFTFTSIQSNYFRKFIELGWSFGTQPNIGMGVIENLKLVVPSNIKEQEEIVEYLDNHTKEIDDLISMEQNKVELLKEYRQSLISEVITGKIKVI
jgi:type I restriction enzyme, S subunit